MKCRLNMITNERNELSRGRIGLENSRDILFKNLILINSFLYNVPVLTYIYSFLSIIATKILIISKNIQNFNIIYDYYQVIDRVYVQSFSSRVFVRVHGIFFLVCHICFQVYALACPGCYTHMVTSTNITKLNNYRALG